MRPSEIVLLAFDFTIMLLLLFRSNRSKSLVTFIVGAATLIVLLNLTVDGYRWQMMPAFFLTTILVFLSLSGLKNSNRSDKRGWSAALIGFIALVTLLIAALIPVLLPVPTLKKPTGPYAVGTMTLHLVDQDRIERYSTNSDAPREIMVQLWYPATLGENDFRAAYIEQLDKAAPIIAERLGLPSFLLQHLNLVRTHSYNNPQPVTNDAGFPLILFSHGLAGLRMQNSALFEHLASHGYIVASADHTFDSIFTVFPDGRVTLHQRESIFPEDVSLVEAGHQLVNERTQDLDLIVDELRDLANKRENPIAMAINFEKIGAGGHSTGGGTAISYCYQSSDCQAVFALDGWLEPVGEKTLKQDLGRPTMLINTTEWLNQDNQILGQQFISAQKESTFKLTVTGMNHNNFTDIPLLSPLTPVLGLAGSIDRHAGIKITNDYSLAFLNQFLLDSQQPMLLDPSNAPPEVLFESTEK